MSARCGTSSCFDLLIALLLCLVDLVWHYNYLVGNEGAGHFVFHWLITCLLSVVVYLRFLLVTLEGCILSLWLLVDIFIAILHVNVVPLFPIHYCQ